MPIGIEITAQARADKLVKRATPTTTSTRRVLQPAASPERRSAESAGRRAGMGLLAPAPVSGPDRAVGSRQTWGGRTQPERQRGKDAAGGPTSAPVEQVGRRWPGRRAQSGARGR